MTPYLTTLTCADTCFCINLIKQLKSCTAFNIRAAASYSHKRLFEMCRAVSSRECARQSEKRLESSSDLAHEGGCYEVNTLLNAEDKVLLVLLGDGGEIYWGAG